MDCLRNNTAAILFYTREHLISASELTNSGYLNDPQGLFSDGIPVSPHKNIAEIAQMLNARYSAFNMLNDESFLCSIVGTGRHSLQTRHLIDYCLRILLIFLTCVTNSLVTVVFMQKSMRTPANWLLVSIAIADLFTALPPLPYYISAVVTGAFHEHINVTKLYLMNFLKTLISTVFHIASIWFTVLLAVQRLVYVCYSLKVVRFPLCNTTKLKYAVGSVAIASLVLTLPYMVVQRFHYGLRICIDASQQDGHYSSGIIKIIDHPTIAIYKCHIISGDNYSILTILRTILVNIIPSLLLIWITVQLTLALRKFNRNRRKLLDKSLKHSISQNKQAERSNTPNETINKRRSSPRERESTSKMMLVILGIFLSVEVPITFFITFYVVNLQLGITETWLSEAMGVCNTLVLLSYPANFFVYFAMSNSFRSTFKKTFPNMWRILASIRRKPPNIAESNQNVRM